MKQVFNALTIAGSDSGGGAGIQADLKTFSALGCYGCTVITALTAQNTQGVEGIFAVTPEFVRRQAQAVFDDIRIDTVKIGMLADVAIIKQVAAILQQYKPAFVVLDPVMVAKGGQALLQREAMQAIVEYLFPLADIITPNLPEAAALLNTTEAVDQAGMQQQAQALLDLGVKNVLLKGGHLAGNQAPDCLVEQTGAVSWYQAQRIDSKHTHGTGCTLSSAIAALYPQQPTLAATIAQAKQYLHQAILAGKDWQIGKGIGPVNHFHQFWS